LVKKFDFFSSQIASVNVYFFHSWIEYVNLKLSPSPLRVIFQSNPNPTYLFTRGLQGCERRLARVKGKGGFTISCCPEGARK
jgi:hypothetical protein